MNAPPARILSVEDDPHVRRSIMDWLQDSGFEMRAEATGKEGVAAFGEFEPDLVLLDMGLPDISGLEVLARLHERSPDTPVVIVSGGAQISDAIGAFKAGAWDYVTKPIMNFDALEQTIRNCLERKALKEEIRLAEARYSRLLQNLPVVIFSLDRDLGLSFINDTSLEVLGYTPDEMLADPPWFTSRIHQEDLAKVQAAFESVRSGRERGFRLGFRFRHKKGYLLHLSAQSLLMADNDAEGGGQADALSGIITDVTERVFLEKVLVQREKLNTLGAMSHELAHEIRNPLMSLGGFAKRLADKHPEIPETGIILEQAVRLEKLMNRISAYVAPVPVKTQQVNVAAVLTFCLDRLAPGLVREGLDIRPRLDMALPDIHSDPDLLTDILAGILNYLARIMTAENSLIIHTRQSPSHVSVEFELQGPAEGLPANPDSLLLPFDGQGAAMDLALAYRNLKNLGGMLALSRERKDTAVLTASLPLGRKAGG
ncbi:response regulator [Desulfocurvus sp. DL9XJH121]